MGATWGNLGGLTTFCRYGQSWIGLLALSATKTLRGVEGVWVIEMNVSIEDGSINGYKVNLEVTFQLKVPS
jgi:hypothetical protein